MKIEAVSYLIDNALAEGRNVILRLHNGSIVIASSENCNIYWDWNAIALNKGEEIISCDSIDHILKGDVYVR